MSRAGPYTLEVHARGFVRATPRQAWGVLTDYERLHQFVPDLRLSRVLSRQGQESTVEQESSAGFLFVRHTIKMVLRITEHPHSAIDVALVKGDMKHYLARWELVAASENGERGTLITYVATMEPAFFLPPVVGKPVVQANVQKVVAAVVAEIESRRAAR